MPSFTEDHAGPDSEVPDSPPISGTGLNIPSLRKVLQGGNLSASPPDGTTLKQYRASVSKATARPPIPPTSMPSAISSQSSARLDDSTLDASEQPTKPDDDPQLSLYHQVYDWLQHEKVRRQSRKAHRAEAASGHLDDAAVGEERTASDSHHSSDSTFSLDKLERILHQYAGSRSSDGLGALQPFKRTPRRRLKGLRRGSASDSDYADVDAPVPTVEAILDNSKTLAYASSIAAADDNSGSGSSSKRSKDREAWLIFKNEIARLAHTLQLRGWRKLPMEQAGDIEVVRLSGALTNAVYVVAAPKHFNIPRVDSGAGPLTSKKRPPKLLLRIYGPQVDHLIDRENELQILRRLGRKNIGPRVLGTFMNGRFEEYLEARPLTPKELRMPETAKQIAKRMRELHDGIDLLDEEREAGPMIFKNWDKWVDRCEAVTTWLDKELDSVHNEAKSLAEPWRRRGYVCGVPWAVFRKAVENYRAWLIASCGGIEEIKRQLVFAHNDTQYGNLLRMEPATESPLLLPANHHKQLVVIDFEYASANTRGLEFANHFTEWCYNYHDEERPWACNTRLYPTPEEQYRFVSTYLSHRPTTIDGGPISPLGTPALRGRSAPAITPLSLDDNPDGPNWQIEKAEDDHEAGIRELVRQTRVWRVMNSAQWVAWGIVQAKAPGIEEALGEMRALNGHEQEGQNEVKKPPVDSDVDEEDGFDYLAYAQDRAMFFWSDLLALNLVNPDELPAQMVEHLRARIVDC